jgi:hypothetical protein
MCILEKESTKGQGYQTGTHMQRERKHYKQINQQYNKYYLMTKKTVPANDTHHYEHVGARIIQIGATIKKLWKFEVNRLNR